MIVESACFDSPAPPSLPGQGAPTIGLLDKIKFKVGLNKKKVSNVNVSPNESSNGNSDVYNVSKVNTRSSNDQSNANTSSNSSKSKYEKPNSNVSSQIVSEQEYIGQGVLAGRENDSDMELPVESQKRSHPDLDSVDSVDDGSFVVPVALRPCPSKKKPAVVVSPGTVRPAVVDRNSNRDCSRSPKRSPVALLFPAHMPFHLVLAINPSPLEALVPLKATDRNKPSPQWCCQLYNLMPMALGVLTKRQVSCSGYVLSL